MELTQYYLTHPPLEVRSPACKVVGLLCSLTRSLWEFDFCVVAGFLREEGEELHLAAALALESMLSVDLEIVLEYPAARFLSEVLDIFPAEQARVKLVLAAIFLRVASHYPAETFTAMVKEERLTDYFVMTADIWCCGSFSACALSTWLLGLAIDTGERLGNLAKIEGPFREVFSHLLKEFDELALRGDANGLAMLELASRLPSSTWVDFAAAGES
jgi:hypothetical protein